MFINRIFISLLRKFNIKHGDPFCFSLHYILLEFYHCYKNFLFIILANEIDITFLLLTFFRNFILLNVLNFCFIFKTLLLKYILFICFVIYFV